MKTYEEYFQEALRREAKRQVEYEKKRRQQAQTAVAKVNDTYARLENTATERYSQAAQETEAAYREVFDANAVNELVARRHSTESMRNANLSRSGLSTTAQTSISLARGRADTAAARQKQTAVDRLMRELDTVRTQYREQSESEQAAIRADADADIHNYNAAREDAAHRYAAAMVETNQTATPNVTETLYAKVIEGMNAGLTITQAYESAMGRDYTKMSAYEAGKQKRDRVSYQGSSGDSQEIKELGITLRGSDLAKYRVASNAATLWANGAFGDTRSEAAVEALNNYLLEEAWRGNLPTIDDVGDVLVAVTGGHAPYSMFAG